MGYYDGQISVVAMSNGKLKGEPLHDDQWVTMMGILYLHTLLGICRTSQTQSFGLGIHSRFLLEVN